MIIGLNLSMSDPKTPWNGFPQLMEAHGLERGDLAEWLDYWDSLSREEQADLRVIDLNTL